MAVVLGAAAVVAPGLVEPAACPARMGRAPDPARAIKVALLVAAVLLVLAMYHPSMMGRGPWELPPPRY